MGAHVVVIEDDPGIAASLARTLEGQDAEVTWAKLNGVLAFWPAHVLTRPLGGSIGDFLTCR